MKRIATTLAISLLCLTAFSQKDSTAKKDTSKFTKETRFLNLETIDRIMATKKNNISVGDWEIFYGILNRFLLPDAIKEFEEKSKPSPAKK